MNECRSCHRATNNTARWSPVIRNGEVVGHTCPKCPKWGEPIRRVQNGAGVRFRVTLDVGNDAQGRRRQETKVLPTLEAAREYVASRGVELRAQRKAGHVVGDRLTVDELCTRWLAAKEGEVRPGTHETYAHRLKPVRRYFGNRKVASLTHADVVRFRKWLSEDGGRNGGGLGNHAARGSLTGLKSILDHAVRVERAIQVNPATGVRPLKVDAENGQHERWSADQLVQFIGTSDNDRLGAIWRLSAIGLRREEVLGLRWSDIDFDAGTITVRQTRVAVSKDKDSRLWTIGDPKSKHSWRTIRPDSIVPGTIAALRALNPRELAAVGPHTPATLPVNEGDNPDGLIVVDEAGRPMRPRTYSDCFTALCKSAGVPAIRLHSTRHTVAYLLHDAGVPPVRAAAFLGHRLDVHLTIYLFAKENDVDLAGDALGGVLAAAAVA